MEEESKGNRLVIGVAWGSGLWWPATSFGIADVRLDDNGAVGAEAERQGSEEEVE